LEIETGITPPRKISDDTPSYPPLAKRLNQEGTVSLRLIVTEEGDPIELEIVESAGPILDAAVREAVQKWEFEKDIKNRPLCVKILLRV
jgi:protein TonB